MIAIDVPQLAKVCSGTLLGDGASTAREVRGLSWDTRTLEPGNIFLAMPGQRVDGNDFIVRAIAAKAACILCTRAPDDATRAIAGEFSCPIVVVADGVAAMTALAAWWRERIRAVVVGVTGSTGKTSTKDFLAAVLGRHFKTAATQGNHNNELGVPQTVLAADKDTEVLVVEMGMRGPGQIERLCGFVKPSIGVVTNIGVAHMELLGSQEAIARAKAELLAALPSDGLAVVNADDARTPLLLEAAHADERGLACRSFGLSPVADVRASEVSAGEDACASFFLHVRASEPARQVRLSAPGGHNVENALAAATVADFLGMPFNQIAAGLGPARPQGMRMQLSTWSCGTTFINDAYNANPDSMDAALSTLAAMECAGRRIAVLGDMGELGDDERELHAQVGRRVAACGIDRLVCVGTLAVEIADGAVSAGMPAGAVHRFEDVAQARSYLRSQAGPDDVVLVKASRFMGLEKIIEETEQPDV